jgi:hypothetical protein
VSRKKKIVMRLNCLVVRTANPRQLTDALESVDISIDERSLQVDPLHLDRVVPIAGCHGEHMGEAAQFHLIGRGCGGCVEPNTIHSVGTCFDGWGLSLPSADD